MSSSPRSRRAGAALGVVSLAAVAVTGLATADAAGAASAVNPYSPAGGHSYRHGVLPTIGTLQKMKNYSAAHPNVAAATGPQTLSYGGGVDGIGVQSGHSKVYFVFYGNQWGTQTTDANGNAKFSNDSAGAAGAAQQMFKGIGTNNELWSADLTQWCDGAGVAAGATSCPASGASYIPYQSGGVLSGVWYDNSVASPSAASALQLGQEAVNAAAHFGNTTAASNRYAYYVILSPHGTNPDNYQGAYCAWHDWNGDVGASSPYGDIAFSNQPYNIDSGYGCGVGFVNSPGTLDGWTMTLGHEWHEEMSDQNPAGGWTNHTGSSYNGQENSDECAWLSPGTSGGAANVSFGSFGTYAEQASWSNDTNSCAISHAIVNHGTASYCGEASCTPVQAAYISHFTGAGCTGTESYYTPYFGYDGIRRSWDGNGNAGTVLRTVTNRSYRSSDGVCHDAWPNGNTLSDFVTIYRGSCGEASCTPVQAAYISHFTGVGCTGTESYYTPYFGYDGIRRSWDGHGNAGTILRTVTNRSYRSSDGVCHDAWPNGNTLSDFVTIYR